MLSNVVLSVLGRGVLLLRHEKTDSCGSGVKDSRMYLCVLKMKLLGTLSKQGQYNAGMVKHRASERGMVKIMLGLGQIQGGAGR